MRHLLLVLVLFVLVLPVTSGVAQVPEFMSYQGVIRDASGNPVPDGPWLLTFRLYDVPTGGLALWTEHQTVTTSGGIANVMLGKVTSFSTVEFDVPYWLGISVEGGAELTPRTELATAPYAAHAAYADHCNETDDDWDYSGDNIYRTQGYVGVGTLVPNTKLHVWAADERAMRIENYSGTSNFSLLAQNWVGTAGAFYSGYVEGAYPNVPTAVFGVAGPGSQGGYFSSVDENIGLTGQSEGTGPAIWGNAYGTGLSGWFTGGLGMECDNQIKMAGFRMDTGAVPGYVLTSDASGVGTWQPASGGGSGDITAVYAQDGLYGGATSGDAYINVGEGPGIEVTADAVGLNVGYSTGSVYDSRFVNELQASSVNSSMITNGEVSFADMQNVFDLGANTWWWSQTTGMMHVDHTGANYPVMQLDNETNGNDGDCLYLQSTGSTAGSSTYVLFSNTYNGKAAQFTKFQDDNAYCVQINGNSSTSEGLYVSGTIVSTGSAMRSVATSRGHEPVFGVDSPEQEVVASGRATLAGGKADVPFDRMFTESVAADGDVRVTATPIGGWSALYVESTSPDGFAVRSASGDMDIEFYWTAVGRSKDAPDKATITLPDPEEERRIEAAKMAALE